MGSSWRSIVTGSLLVLVAAGRGGAQSAPQARLEVDAREAPRGIFHAVLTLPVSPGPLVVVYPKWIPGEHGPTGPIADLAGLRFKAGGKEIAWRRDSTEMFAFHLEVPAGAKSLEVSLDYLSPAESGQFSSGVSATSDLALVSWNTLLLSPQGKSSDDLTYAASLRLPEGWKYGTALPVQKQTGDRIDFAAVSLTTLVDSPVLTGEHFRTISLGTDAPPHRIHIAADSEAALEATPELVKGWTNLVAETGKLFGARHYKSYSFLLTLSDHTAHFGLEHHESSDDRVAERALVDSDERRLWAGLLPHEMVHSWNGKYRRPAGLAPGGYEAPMRGDLLWVYEGLTTYLGGILSARTGLLTPEQYRENLAETAAAMDHQAGRSWRPLADTAVAAQVLYGSRQDGQGWRRAVDFYPESDLLWLEADTVIRRETQGKMSLDDFCRQFHGGKSGPPEVATYTFDDVVAALNRIAPYDWAGFWRSRVEDVQPRAPLAGITAGGWRLVYTDAVPAMQKSYEERRKLTDVRFSIGFVVHEDGALPDVLPGSPADKAGVPAGSKLVAVNGRRFHRETLREAIRETKTASRPIELLVEDGEFFKTYRLDYKGGERYPHLEPDPGKPDVLSRIIAAGTS